MTYDSVERSVEDAQRVDLFTFSLPGATYRLCTGDADQTFGGDVYSVAPISSSDLELVPIGGNVREVTVSLALDHDLAIELRQGGLPPQNALVTIRRIHLGDTGSRVWWQGYIGGTSTSRTATVIRVPNKIDLAFDCGLPIKLAERRCPHVLGDVGCGVDLVAGGFRITPTVASVSADGSALIVSSMSGKPDAWARDGKIIRVADGERRTVVSQIGTTIALDFPFRELANGDALDVFAGCDRSLLGEHGCKVKFNNVPRFGGEPHIPDDNPAAPTGAGVARG